MGYSCRYENRFKGVLCGGCSSCNMIISAIKLPGSNGMTWEEYRDIALQMYFRRQMDEDIYFEEQKFIATGKRYHNFITLNFSPDHDILEVIQILKNWDIEWLRNTKAVAEFHTENGGHPHIHLISYTKRKKNIIIRDLSAKFNMKANFFDVTNRSDLYTKHINYINGLKKDKKLLFCDLDAKWRKEQGIPELLNF